jgi:hypothetical protein
VRQLVGALEFYQSGDKSPHSKVTPKSNQFEIYIKCLVSYGRTGGTSADWAPVMLRVGTSKRLIDARFDVALRLATHCCQFRNDQITSPFEHPLLAERQGFEIAQIS